MNLKSGGGKAERFELVDLCRERGIEPIVLHPGDDLRRSPRTPSRAAPTSSAWPAATARRRSSPRWRASTASRSSSSPRGPATTSRSTSASTATTSSAPSTPTTTASTGGRPRRGQRPRLRQQRVDGRVREDRPVGGLPRRQGADGGRHAARPARAGRGAARPALHAAVGRAGDHRPAAARVEQPLPALRTCAAAAPASASTAACSGSSSVLVRRRRTPRSSPRSRPPARSGGSPAGTSGPRPSSRCAPAEPVEVGVDGEALTLEPPLRFVIRPGALTVRLPRTAPGRRPPRARVRVRPAHGGCAVAHRPRPSEWEPG